MNVDYVFNGFFLLRYAKSCEVIVRRNRFMIYFGIGFIRTVFWLLENISPFWGLGTGSGSKFFSMIASCVSWVMHIISLFLENPWNPKSISSFLKQLSMVSLGKELLYHIISLLMLFCSVNLSFFVCKSS